MSQQSLLLFVIAWTVVGAFIFTVAITLLSMIGKIKFSDANQQKTLFKVLVVEVVVVCIALFKGLFEPSKIGIPPINPTPTEQASLFIEENKKLSSISADVLAQSLNPGSGGFVWSQFYRYRSLIRQHMRRLCHFHSIAVAPDESYRKMAEKLLTASIINADLYSDIEKIGHATYTTQWGAGDQPTPQEALFVANNAEKVIEKLSKVQ